MIFRTQDRSWCDVVGDMYDYYEADSSGQLFSNTEILDSAFVVGVSRSLLVLYEIRQQLYNSLTLLMIFTYAEMLQL